MQTRSMLAIIVTAKVTVAIMVIVTVAIMVMVTTDTGRTIPAMDDTVFHTTATTADILELAFMGQATDSRLAFRKPTREVQQG